MNFQDTHYCPDGWVVSNVGQEIECVLLGGTNEYVTKVSVEYVRQVMSVSFVRYSVTKIIVVCYEYVTKVLSILYVRYSVTKAIRVYNE